MKEKEFEKLFKALGNRRRILILKYLKEKSKASVGNIAHEIKLSFKSTSRHLMILFQANIIEKEQVSLNMIYSLVSSNHIIVTELLKQL